jgi:hypothetical protein
VDFALAHLDDDIQREFRAGTVVLAQKPPSTLSMSSTTSARFAKKAPASRMPRKLPQLAANIEASALRAA